MSALKDITGQRFGRLVAVEPTLRRGNGGEVIWACRCDCGKMITINGIDIRKRNTKSCGCLLVELWGEKIFTHKLTADQVNDIRHRYAAGFVTQRELAEEFQIDKGQISRIITGKRWKNLPGGPITRMSPVTRAPRIRQARRIKQRNEGVTMSKK